MTERPRGGSPDARAPNSTERPRGGTAEWLRRGSSFGAVAGRYAKHRPDYAEAAVRWALAPVVSRRPLRLVDLGAGTGKLTAALIRVGAGVTAVEPDPNMLAELRRGLPAVRALHGSAENIPLPGNSADAVLAGQAMHWFDLDRAVPEIARVLAPGGVVAGLWNVDDDRVGWVAELAEITRKSADITLTAWRDRLGRARREGLATAGAGLFGSVEVGEFRHGQRRTADSLLATIATHSAVLVMDEPERAGMLARARDFLHGQPQTSGGEFVLPMFTVVLRALRAARGDGTRS